MFFCGLPLFIWQQTFSFLKKICCSGGAFTYFPSISHLKSPPSQRISHLAKTFTCFLSISHHDFSLPQRFCCSSGAFTYFPSISHLKSPPSQRIPRLGKAFTCFLSISHQNFLQPQRFSHPIEYSRNSSFSLIFHRTSSFPFTLLPFYVLITL